MAYSTTTLMIIFVLALVWTGALTTFGFIIYDPGIGSVFILWMIFGLVCRMKLAKSSPKYSAPSERQSSETIVISG